ncbi:beta-1,3-galactosyl-O-glycosyl-glycoprotein beta-1,6-N-acetylglucosaminyltransferase 3 [Nematolebias whitei]|uniref:beta-1,3-galactosyl-O-glycosyl-glycoprotein beta-1,6-N-acetylglucosaminyltransferase 3 n=1 Tax=Nematolebias whitei TaxID=451745 RepID=UPI001898F5F7|nr:beta-1,3-galactosyl-O-glycosyl-glycoprotein beta-1,6-N-acetylglucosaminyltransferase 3 [Nematolebias whitei]
MPLKIFLFMVLILLTVFWNNAFKKALSSYHQIPQQFSEDLPGCLAIISGNAERKKTTLEALQASRKRPALPADFYINVTKDCPAFIEKRSFITVPLSEEEKHFPIAFSIVIHEKIEMFERLLRAIYAPQNIYCIHVDLKSPLEFQTAVRSIVSCFPNVFIASKLENVLYAAWTRVQADLNCMKDLLKSNVQWKYLLNTCGTDFPIKTNREMVMALKALNGRNNLESVPVISTHKFRWKFHFNVTTGNITRTFVNKSPPPISVPMFQGSAYFIFSRVLVKHLIEYNNKEVQYFMEWEKDTFVPDETFWATLQRMPSVPLSTPAHSLYDVTDMGAIVRLTKWSFLAGDVKKGAPYSDCTGKYQREVCVYGAGDLLWLLRQHHLFANKFDPEVDDVAIRCVESILRFRALGQDPLPTQEYSGFFL